MLKALLVILGIAGKRDAAREEKEKGLVVLVRERARTHARTHAQTSAKTVEHRSCSHANQEIVCGVCVESGVDDNIALAGTLYKGSLKLCPPHI